MTDRDSIISRIEAEAYRYLLVRAVEEDIYPECIFISTALYVKLTQELDFTRQDSLIHRPIDQMSVLTINLPFDRSSIYPIDIAPSDFIMAGKRSDIGKIQEMIINKEFEKIILED